MHEPDADREEQAEPDRETPAPRLAPRAQRRAWRAAAAAETSYLLSVVAR